MTQPHVYEGTPTELARELLELPASQTFRMTLTPEESTTEEQTESLQAAIARMTSRTPEEIASLRERVLSATPPARELPEGKSLFDVVMHTWPGDESDEEVYAALEKLS